MVFVSVGVVILGSVFAMLQGEVDVTMSLSSSRREKDVSEWTGELSGVMSEGACDTWSGARCEPESGEAVWDVRV